VRIARSNVLPTITADFWRKNEDTNNICLAAMACRPGKPFGGLLISA
jgi:hypothetical protein